MTSQHFIEYFQQEYCLLVWDLRYLLREVHWQKIRRGASLKFEVELALSYLVSPPSPTWHPSASPTWHPSPSTTWHPSHSPTWHPFTPPTWHHSHSPTWHPSQWEVLILLLGILLLILLDFLLIFLPGLPHLLLLGILLFLLLCTLFLLLLGIFLHFIFFISFFCPGGLLLFKVYWMDREILEVALGCRASAIIYRKTRVYGDYQWIIAINASARPLTLQPNATPSGF